MLLSAAVIGLVMAGCWLFCLGDAALTPPSEFPGLRKGTWIALIALTFVVGGIAWLVAHRALLGRRRKPNGLALSDHVRAEQVKL